MVLWRWAAPPAVTGCCRRVSPAVAGCRRAASPEAPIRLWCDAATLLATDPSAHALRAACRDCAKAAYSHRDCAQLSVCWNLIARKRRPSGCSWSFLLGLFAEPELFLRRPLGEFQDHLWIASGSSSFGLPPPGGAEANGIRHRLSRRAVPGVPPYAELCGEGVAGLFPAGPLKDWICPWVSLGVVLWVRRGLSL